MHLLIVSHVIHYRWQDRIWAFGGYAREVEIWAELFPQVSIACPVRAGPPPGDHLPFEHPNIDLWPVAERGGDSLSAKIAQIIALPQMISSLISAMRSADAIQVRCPGNLGLLGVILAPLFSRYRIAKYAGQWVGYAGEPATFRFQRSLLRSRWWNAPVLVYGGWPDQPAHVIPFFTSLINAEMLAMAKAATENKGIHQPIRILFVGRLARQKNIHVLIEAISILRMRGIEISCEIIGIGPEQENLQKMVLQESLGEIVHFTGGLAYQEVLGQYVWADILVLASEAEGWPKAIAEAMTFGVVCVGSNLGLVPRMLEQNRGLCIQPGNAQALADALQSIQSDPLRYIAMSKSSAAWAQQYTIESLQKSIKYVLEEHWRVALKTPEQHAA